MAIKDMKGTVVKNQPTMTGMVNKSAAKITPPNMSKIKMPIPKKQVVKKPAQTKPIQSQSAQTNLAEKVQNLTNEDEARAMIYKNSSTRLTASRYFQGQNGTINYQCGVAADLSVGDTVEFKTRQVSGGAKNAEGTSDVSYFLGYRIGG